MEKKGISKLDAKLDLFIRCPFFFVSENRLHSFTFEAGGGKHSKKEEEFFVVSSNKVSYVAQDKAGKKILNVRVHPNKAMEDYITRWRRTNLFNLYRQVVL